MENLFQLELYQSIIVETSRGRDNECKRSTSLAKIGDYLKCQCGNGLLNGYNALIASTSTNSPFVRIWFQN